MVVAAEKNTGRNCGFPHSVNDYGDRNNWKIGVSYELQHMFAVN